MACVNVYRFQTIGDVVDWRDKLNFLKLVNNAPYPLHNLKAFCDHVQFL